MHSHVLFPTSIKRGAKTNDTALSTRASSPLTFQIHELIVLLAYVSDTFDLFVFNKLPLQANVLILPRGWMKITGPLTKRLAKP